MRIKISSLDKYVVIDAPDNIYRNIWQSYFLAEYIPSVSVLPVDDSDNTDLTIIQGGDFSWSNSTITTTENDSDIRSIIVIVGSLLEKLRQEHGFYQVHGSAVKVRNRSVAIVGGMSGIGKTSLALNLLSFADVGFIADEKFVMDGAQSSIVGGCPVSRDNKKTGLKVPFDLELISSPMKIGMFVFPIITNEPELTVFKLDALKLFWHLYEESTRDIRGLNFLYNNFTETHQGYDTDGIAKQRLDDIRNISEHVPAYFIRGNISNVSDFVYNFMTSST